MTDQGTTNGARSDVTKTVRALPYGAHHGRLDLTRALPLATPLSLLIDPGNACNFRCFFCATGQRDLLAQVGRPKGLMPVALFEKIIDDLSMFPNPLKSLHLYKDGEPLVHKHFTDLVRHAKQAGVAYHVETTSNGALLTAATTEAILEAGLDGIRISVYGTNDREYAETTRSPIGYDTVLTNVRFLARRRDETSAGLHIHCKLLTKNLDATARSRFLEDFGPISDSIFVHPVHGQSLALPDFQKTPDTERQVCSEPFIKLAINFDGQVSACCADWAMRAIVGDVKQQSVHAIWNGPELHKFRMLHLAGRRFDLDACRSCCYITSLPVENNLDAVARTLANRYADAMAAD